MSMTREGPFEWSGLGSGQEAGICCLAKKKEKEKACNDVEG